jgi:hypothetical protein
MIFSEMSDEQLRDLEAKARAELSARCAAKTKAVESRRESGDPFGDGDLIYAARARCDCGAGMAYPKDIGIRGSWECADILTRRAIQKDQQGAKTHSPALPFAFYEIKSENQPSANGATTRPASA